MKTLSHKWVMGVSLGVAAAVLLGSSSGADPARRGEHAQRSALRLTTDARRELLLTKPNRDPCECLEKDGDAATDWDGDVGWDPPTCPDVGVRLSEGGALWDWGWVEYQWHLPSDVQAFSYLQLSALLEDTWGDGPTLQVCNWQSQNWTEASSGTAFGDYAILCSPEISVHMRASDRLVRFRVNADWNDDSRVCAVEAYYCVAEPDIRVVPAELNFGDVARGTLATETPRIWNDGDAVLIVDEIAVTQLYPLFLPAFGCPTLVDCGSSFYVSPGEYHDVEIGFLPMSFSGYLAELEIRSNDPDEVTVIVAAVGTGVGPSDINCAGDLDEASLDYADTGVGCDSGWQSVTIRNDGGLELDGELQIVGTGQGHFDCPDEGSFSIGVGDEWTVSVRFHPMSSGAKNATLRINSNDPDEATCDIPLSGTGLPPDLQISESDCTPYDDVEPGQQMSLMHRVQNCGAGYAFGPFQQKWFISIDDDVTTSDRLWISHQTTELSPGGWQHVTTLPPDWPSEEPYNHAGQTYYVCCMADSDGDVSESDEGNNWGQLLTVTLAGDPHGADLRIANGECGPLMEIVPGTTQMTLVHLTCNGGDVSSWTLTKTRWYISLDADVSTGDYEWTSQDVPTLSPGMIWPGIHEVCWPDIPPYNQLGSTYYVRVMADATDVVDETDEGNNWGPLTAITLAEDGLPPVADAGGPYTGAIGQTLCFDASGSHDPDGFVTGYRWDWTNNGSWDTDWLTSPYVCHVYDTFTGAVRLQVKDNLGGTAIDTASVTVTPGTTYLHGTVRNAASGAAISGATVALTGEGSVSTNSQGYYDFGAVEAGTKTLTVSKTGFVTWQDTVVLAPETTVNKDVYLSEHVTTEDPAVLSIDGNFCSPSGLKTYYLRGVYAWDMFPLMDTFTVQVNWGDHPSGNVRWDTGYDVYLDPCSGRSTCAVSRQFNMTSDFPARGELAVTAIAGDGTQSVVKKANLRVVSPPPGIMMALLHATPTGDQLSYHSPSLSTDPSKLEEGSDGVPEDMPLFGGEAFKFVAAFDFEATVDAHGNASGLKFEPDLPGDEKKTKIAGYEWGPSFDAALNWTY